MLFINEHPGPEFGDFLQGVKFVNYLVKVEADSLKLAPEGAYFDQEIVEGKISCFDIHRLL